MSFKNYLERAMIDHKKETLNKKEKYYIVGYGSLINKRSLLKTVDDVIDFSYVKVEGFKRIFNVPGLRGVTFLNAEKDSSSFINGVLIQVNGEELKKIFKRERSYSMLRVPIESITFPYGKSTPLDESDDVIISSLEKNTSEDKAPLLTYLNACLYGSMQIGEKFYNDFINTTYLSDGRLLKDYMDKNLPDRIIEKFKTKDSSW